MAERAVSLRRRLTLWLLVAVSVLWANTAALSFFDARHELDELLDAHLAQSASLLLVQAASGGKVLPEHAPLPHKYARRVVFQVWEDGRRLRLHSANAPDRRLSPRDDGLSDVVLDGRRWRVFSLSDDEHRMVVQVGEQLGARDEIGLRIAGNLLWPLAGALPLLGVLTWLIVWRATAPLSALGRQIAQRDPANLEPVRVRQAPAEVVPLVASLNHLLARVRASLEGERRFTADAARELRTPIAALRAQAQVARNATDTPTRVHALDQVIAGCDRAARLVDQLLTLARLDPARTVTPAATVDLGEVARSTIASMADAALRQGAELELEAEPDARVAGDAPLLAILLRNLIDNAVRHAPPASAVQVRVRMDTHIVSLEVVDAGPGVAESLRKRLGERFFRAGAPSGEGTGLGLSIVRRIAELHHARLSFDARGAGPGLIVRVTFPRVSCPAGQQQAAR